MNTFTRSFNLAFLLGLLILHVQCQDICDTVYCGSGMCISTKNPTLPYFCRCPSGANTILPCPAENPCSHNPCGHGVCELVPSLVHGYLCRCSGDIISLTSCNITQHGCHSNPCVNGLCIEGLTSFVCHCLPHWTGKFCTERLPSPCAQNPCQMGRCFELNDPVAPYVCLCPNAQFGLSCRSWEYLTSTARMFPHFVPASMATTTMTTTTTTTTTTTKRTTTTARSPEACDPFDPQSCMNGGRCLATMHSFRCLCQPGFTGIFCEANINECASNPCQHGGICYDLQASYMCFCPDGTFRTQCTPKPISTSTARIQHCPCQNGGLCSMDGLQECSCPIGFTGRFCERPIPKNKCSGIRCLNGGSCYENGSNPMNSIQCTCPHGYTGKYCETEYFRCRSNGRFTDVYQCENGKYFECIHFHDGSSSNSYGVLLSRSCPVSLRFNVEADRCDYPLSVVCPSI